MALDWNKEINLSTLKNLFNRGKNAATGGGANTYPSKTTMNLYQGDQQTNDVKRVGIVAVLLAVAIAVFVKFGVVDQIALLSSKQAELAQQQGSLNSLVSATTDYEEIKEIYDAYLIRYGNTGIDAIEVLDMVEKDIMSASTVSSIVLSDGTLTLTLNDVTLNTVGDLAKKLENMDMVQSVNITSANTNKSDDLKAEATMVVTLVSNQSGEGE